ncbi:hypothetical protein [Rubrivirga sp.]|uniref:hypothetical protein n=1 Tax=Rubrivirga sp. TaxID=1885344 RepID=UPI003B51958A
MTGTVLGYDPGGNGKHGVARLTVAAGEPRTLDVATMGTVEDVVRLVEAEAPLAVGADTLTCWSTGPSGWRPADRWLRAAYPASQRSVASPNSLYGSMSLGGMAVLLAARSRDADVPITEAHPKALYRAFWHRHYDYAVEARSMDADLGAVLGVEVRTGTDHEWDAAVAALAALHLLRDDWPRDLHALPTADGERLVAPCGPTRFVWPE